MTWHELQTRARQGVTKRLDLVQYRAGLLTNPNGWNNRFTNRGRFFFSAEDLPLRAAFLKEHLATEMEAIIRDADEILNHRFRLLGYDRLDYGPEIDWHLDVVHGKRSPLKPWFKIPFLDFSTVGDHKIIWELNRHQHLVILAKAWALTREEKYTVELTRQWCSWRFANPFPLGINWSSSLEVAFRTLSWLWVAFLLGGHPSIPADFEPDLLQALALNGRHIEHNLSTYFSPNTHLLGEAVALFFIGTLCPRIPSAARWRSLGWRIILQEAERQVRSDGVYFEQSLYYHVYALDFFLHARLLAARNGIEIPRNLDATLEKMLDVLQAVSQAGPPQSFGDDDGGRLFNSARNRSEHLGDPLAVGAVLFGRDDLTPSAHLTEEAVWLFGEQAVSNFVNSCARPALKATSFEAGGIYVMASSKRYAQRMVIDAGPMGSGRSGHGHADALNLTVSLNGRNWLVDPGTFCYVSRNPEGRTDERDRFRGTGAHNTLRVDGLDQAVLDGPFAWSSLPSVCMERWAVGTTFSLFAGSHTGYQRLADPVLHRRFVFHLQGGFWLVRDCADGRQQHRLETSWHFASDLRVGKVEGSFLASPQGNGVGGDMRLGLVTTNNSGWRCDLGLDEISPVYGIKRSAPTLRMSAYVPLPTECAVVIDPLLHDSEMPGTLSELSATRNDEHGAVRGYRYDDDRGEAHCMIFATGHRPWTLGPWTSDAEFLYCGTRDAGVRRFILCNGSFASLRGQLVIAHGDKIARLEWLTEAGTSSVFHVGSSGVPSFSEDVLGRCDLAF